MVCSLSTCGTSWLCAFIYSQEVSYFSLVHAWLAFQHRRVICEIKVVCSPFHVSWPFGFIYSKMVSYFSLVHAWLAFQHRRMISEIRMVCFLFHLWYILTMCIHLFSAGKLFSLFHAWLAFQHSRIICEIRMVCSLFHLRYILTMCIHLLSAGKLFFPGSYMFSIPTQKNDPWNLMVCSSTYGTSWPCAFIHSQEVSYFSLVHA